MTQYEAELRDKIAMAIIDRNESSQFSPYELADRILEHRGQSTGMTAIERAAINVCKQIGRTSISAQGMIAAAIDLRDVLQKELNIEIEEKTR